MPCNVPAEASPEPSTGLFVPLHFEPRRLAHPQGAIPPGHWTSRVTDAAATSLRPAATAGPARRCCDPANAP